MHIGSFNFLPISTTRGDWLLYMEFGKRIDANEHQVTMITRGGRHRTWQEEVEGITIVRRTFIPIYPFHVHFHSTYVNRLVREMEEKFDLIHIHTPLVRFPKSSTPALITFHTTMKGNRRSQSVRSLFDLLAKLQTFVSIRLEAHLISKGKTSRALHLVLQRN